MTLDVGATSEEHCRYDRPHAEDGAAYIAQTLRSPDVAGSLRHYHERYDGGVSTGVHGKNIPLEPRIVAVGGAWVAIASGTIYRPAMTPQHALVRLRAGAGLQWDPALVERVPEAIRCEPEPWREPVAVAHLASVMSSPG